MYEMANPYLTEKLTLNRAKILIQDIKEAGIN